MAKRTIPELKPEFKERIQCLLWEGNDLNDYLEILKRLPVKSIRCNKLKISSEELKEKLEKKGWKIKQPWKDYPEVMVIDEEKGKELEPGELGRSLEHLLGYYYVQELSSMLPVIALQPEENELILDLCAAPGSKTTQLASEMKNSGTIIANELSLGRLRILATNTERCGVTNAILTRKEGSAFCRRMKKNNIEFDRILVDAPCSGEGTLRSSYKTYVMWNPKNIKSLSRIQRRLVKDAISILKKGGTMIYSTCTHAPEENEEIVDYIIKEFPEMQIQKIKLPVKSREGITKWRDKEYSKEVKKACRIYPQDNDTEGFFIAKFKRVR